MAIRIFVVDGREHQDPDPKMTPDEVRQYMSSFMPELANAEVIKQLSSLEKYFQTPLTNHLSVCYTM